MMKLEEAYILGNEGYRQDYFLLRLRAPEAAAAAQPGQFVHIRIPNRGDLTLRRPFSIFQAAGGVLSILYKPVGEGTRHLTRSRPGDAVSVLGPLGTGFPPPQEGRVPLLIGGGYGLAALHLVACRSPLKGVVLAGARTAADVLCEGAFRELGWEFAATTEDGSHGTKGLVTVELDRRLDSLSNAELFACGPTGLLRAISERAAARDCPAWVSLDQHMACGMGACLACVQWVLRDGRPQQLRICREGPVFASHEILWNYKP